MLLQISKHYHTKKISENLQNGVQMLKKNFKCGSFYLCLSLFKIRSFTLRPLEMQSSPDCCLPKGYKQVLWFVKTAGL